MQQFHSSWEGLLQALAASKLDTNLAWSIPYGPIFSGPPGDFRVSHHRVPWGYLQHLVTDLARVWMQEICSELGRDTLRARKLSRNTRREMAY